MAIIHHANRQAKPCFLEIVYSTSANKPAIANTNL